METQTLIVVLVIAAAAAHLSRYVWRAMRNMVRTSEQSGCPACAECAFAPSQKAAAPASNFISLDSIRLN